MKLCSVCVFRMGGCRCVYRNCQSSTNTVHGLHYFHFPIRDQKRCDEWIKNSRKQSFYSMPREKLRNKVICSLHFEDKYFTNEKHDRLIHNAVPTLGCEDAPDEEVLENTDTSRKKEENITLIPTSEDNTKFILSDEGFSGMSYTIYDDNVVPTSTLPQYQQTDQKIYAVLRKSANANTQIQKVIKRPKFMTSVVKIQPATKNIKQEAAAEKNITSYSLSTDGNDVKVELSQTQKDDFDQLIESKENEVPLLNNDVTLQKKGENEFSISVLPDIQQNVVDTTEIQNEVIITKNKPDKREFAVTPEKEYIRQIRSNSKQIVELKRLINKQNRLHKFLLQKKQLCKFRKKEKFNKFKIINGLKKFLKPSLLAILKLELLANEDIVMTDEEEKFILQLYTEDPDCYNVLRKKYKWNLPTENTDENKN